jgi:hypothetical protein
MNRRRDFSSGLIASLCRRPAASSLPQSTDIFRVLGLSPRCQAAAVGRAGDGRGLQPHTHLHDGQFPHARHAQIARRANLPQVSALATSGKSERPSRASRLDQEGRFGRSSRYVRWGCGGRCGHVRRTWPKADGEVVWSWRSEAGAKVAGSILRTTVATKRWSPGRARYKP